MNGRSLGYARVSTDDQDLTLQLDALTKHGIPKSHIFTDKLSGACGDRPGLAKCIDSLAQPAPWKEGSKLESLADSPVRLRFVLKDADLYSICFQ